MKIIAPITRVAYILDWTRISKITAVIVEEDVKIIDFSPEKEFGEVMEHIGKKMAELGELIKINLPRTKAIILYWLWASTTT